MQTIKLNKQMQRAMHNHKMSNLYTLRDCYNNYSYAKERAYQYCRDLCDKYNGYDFSIIGYNCMNFSVGFYYKNENDNTIRFVYITKNYDRECIVDNLSTYPQ